MSVKGGVGKIIEYGGEGVKTLSVPERATITNMGAELGATTSIFPSDEVTYAFLKAQGRAECYVEVKPDEDAVYDEVINIDLSAIEPTVACPHLPENTKNARELTEIKPDQVVIGSCTNGRISDMKAAAEILRGKHIAEGIRCIVIPATQKIYKECIKEGYIDIFIDAGCVVSTPTCGPCLGGYMGILASDEIAVATTNRNFVGRMGHVTSKIYLASPEVAAATAVAGKICDPRDL
jgi:3-isopropylmalate/(R)-2-methylmalate dehydratase large subunit